jgi:hypothetical protein
MGSGAFTNDNGGDRREQRHFVTLSGKMLQLHITRYEGQK